MEQRSAIVRHPIYLMLMPFPVALWIFSLASDATYWFHFGEPVWQEIALYSMVAGIGGAAAVALAAYFDYRAIQDGAVASVTRQHMVFNGLIVLLYCFNVALRLEAGMDPLVPLAASVTGGCLLMVSIWRMSRVPYVEPPLLEAQPWERAA
jgi:uncharacterized membrane protein